MLLIEYVSHIGLRSLTDGHLGRHLEYFKTLNDVRVASVGFINYNASTTRINKEKNFKIKFQVILVSTGLCLPVILFIKNLLSSKKNVIMVTMFVLIGHACVERSGFDGTALNWE